MTKKFRNSIFGFNRDDVLSFVLKSDENEARLKSQITELEDDISKLKSELSELRLLQEQTAKILKETEKELEKQKQRESSLTALGESIGRLYLVAQSNAEAVTAAAENNAKQSQSAVEMSLAAATSAEEQLDGIAKALDEKTKEYLDEIGELKRRVASAKESVAENDGKIERLIDESRSVIAGAKQ